VRGSLEWRDYQGGERGRVGVRIIGHQVARVARRSSLRPVLFRKEIKPLLPYAQLRLKHNDTEVDFRLELRCWPNLQRRSMDGESDDQSKTEHGQQVLGDL
jgi:hypothetical protein